ncbi:MAG TPA: SURF1 family protein [Woeseiaceae bacterium]|nr:SURF1 family protein [Woeseiaceae bacterium]
MTEKRASDLLPPLAAVVLVVLFTSLGTWQLDRAEQKRAVQAAFDAPGEYLPVRSGAEYALYQPLAASGRYLYERQFLIDNMILDGQVGYFVVTPFEYENGKPLLLVNRGWVAKTSEGDLPDLTAVGNGGGNPAVTVRGRTGQLPRVGIRAGEAFSGDANWPRTANWPTLAELAAALGRDVLPLVLLAESEAGSGMIRRWEPRQVGPARHIGYAFQWFALAAAVVVITLVLYRKKRRAGQ